MQSTVSPASPWNSYGCFIRLFGVNVAHGHCIAQAAPHVLALAAANRAPGCHGFQDFQASKMSQATNSHWNKSRNNYMSTKPYLIIFNPDNHRKKSQETSRDPVSPQQKSGRNRLCHKGLQDRIAPIHRCQVHVLMSDHIFFFVRRKAKSLSVRAIRFWVRLCGDLTSVGLMKIRY